MTSQNGTGVAPEGDARLMAELLGGKTKPLVTPTPPKKQPLHRRVQRLPASIYRGRARIGRVEPTGVGYRAINIDDLIIGNFDRFNDAVAALDEWGAS